MFMNNSKSAIHTAKRLRNSAFIRPTARKNKFGRRLTFVLFLQFIFLVTLFRCGKQPNQKTYEKNITHFIQRGNKVSPNDTRETVVSKLGKPLGIKKQQVGQENYEILTYNYPTMAVKLVYAPKLNKSFVTEIRILNKKYHLKWGIGVGSSIQKVKKKLGAPTKQIENEWIYVSPENSSYLVRFVVRNNVIKRISFEYGVD